MDAAAYGTLPVGVNGERLQSSVGWALLLAWIGVGWCHSPLSERLREGACVLKLKRVDIQGFKSFYDRTDMRFHGSGIAAVVGPNGCGKSNLSDAIRWVLGHKSAKSLRGSRMEDVIFAGTRERKPLGMAQVTLTMADPAAHRAPGLGQDGRAT